MGIKLISSYTILVFVAFLAGSAFAQDTNTSLEKFNNGYYEDVVEIAKIDPNTENLVLAARALNTIAYLSEKNKPARQAAKEARTYALAAIEKDNQHTEAYVQAAISDALRGSRMSPIRAFMAGLASGARDMLDLALEVEPENPWALSTSGTWHLEVKRAGGGMVYGANASTGYEQVMQARTQLPDNISIAYEAALRFLASGNSDWRQDALIALNVAAQTGPIGSAYEQELRRRAILLQVAVNDGPKAEKTFIKKQH